MFLKSYVEVPLPFADVAAIMLRNPTGWMAGLATQAHETGARLLVDVGLDIGRPLRRPVELEVGRAVVGTRTATLPVRLHGGDGGHLFPSFQGTLDAAWLGPSCTQLALSLDYQPPLGLVGRLADRALLHRVAETMIRDLVERSAGRLTEIMAVTTP